MATVSKRINILRQYANSLGSLTVGDAVRELKGLEKQLPDGVKPCRYDQTVEVAYRLGVDPKQADQIVRGSIVLPHGIGKAQRVVVFAQGDNVALAEEAGAETV